MSESEIINALASGGAQGVSMIAVFALYLDRRLLAIERAILNRREPEEGARPGAVKPAN